MKTVKLLSVLAVVFVAMSFTGCSSQVPPGTIGRVNTSDGWTNEILKSGYHSCWGRDTMYLIDITNKAFPEKMNILVGGKVNLTVNLGHTEYCHSG